MKITKWFLSGVLFLCVASQSASGFDRFRYDLGASAGSDNGDTFFEVNFGLDTFLVEWLSFRNSIFYRTGGGNIKDFAGWDTGARAYLNLPMARFHGGLGYRLTTLGASAPFGEAGALFSVPGFTIGANVKYLAFSVVESGASNQFIYGITLGAGGAF